MDMTLKNEFKARASMGLQGRTIETSLPEKLQPDFIRAQLKARAGPIN